MSMLVNGEALGGIIVGAGVLGAGITRGWRMLGRHVVKENALDRLAGKADQILDQVTPNGGNSGKTGDRLIQMQRSIEKIQANLGDHREEFRIHVAEFTAHTHSDDVAQTSMAAALMALSKSIDGEKK